jgi:hypothetical protein
MRAFFLHKIASILGVPAEGGCELWKVDVANNGKRMMRSISASRMAREGERWVTSLNSTP